MGSSLGHISYGINAVQKIDTIKNLAILCSDTTTNFVFWMKGYAIIILWTQRATFSAVDSHTIQNGRYGIVSHYVEVIGNVFENPELLDL